jgi:DNA helicase-4
VRKRLLLLLHPDAESVFESRVVRRKHKSGKGQKNVRSETEDKALEKAAKKLKIRLPHVMTFHALAYALVHPEESILYDDSESDTQILSSVLQEIIDDHLQVPEFRDKIRELMLAHFREDWESIIKGHYEKSREEFLEYRRSVPRESLNGEYLKSYGEKIIADFLFEHDIKYKYEHNFWWGKRNYRPDFTIFKTAKTGIVIEYFGLHGDPDYDEMAEEKKKFWSKQTKWDLIALSAKDLKNTEGKSFQSFLKTNLKNFGIRCVRLSEHEIWSRVRGRAIDRFTKAIVGFISRCRNQSVTPEDLGRLLDNYTSEARSEKGFLRLAKRFYEVYLERLESTGEEDFNGLVQQAADLVRRGKTVFERRSGTGDLSDLQFLLIDEFQDFSNLFYRLLCEIKKQNNTVSLFCVGDDWQAINGFAGSDLRFFKEFEKYIGEAQRINMLRNYRSMREIVDVSNALMFGYGDRATASKKEQGTVLIADLEKFNPTPLEKQQHQGDILTPAILRISNKALHEDKEVILLSRRNGLPYYINYENNSSSKTGGLEGYLQYIRSFFPDEYKKRIGVSTVHKYKGLESSTVERSYPLIHPDWVFSRVLGDTPQKIIQEERRLFYVALTRAIEELVIITNGKSLSQFLQDILKRKSIVPISWNKYFQLKGRETQIVVKVGNSTPDKRKGTYPIKDLLKASGYRWQTTGWLSWTKIYPSKSFSVDQLKSELWSTEATEVEVRIFNENEELLHRYQVNKGNWKREEKSISPDHMLPNNILRIYHN